MFNYKNALGCDDSHVSNVTFGDGDNVVVHKQLLTPLTDLVDAAARAGFTLGIASGFRGFERQQAIWDAKVSGARPILDEHERPIDVTTLKADEQVQAILRWSALPGASRHHWGSEIDVYDAGALIKGRQLALTVTECETLFANFYRWLDDFLAQQNDFVRPYYQPNKGAVANEPWHLSYLPIAQKYEALCSDSLLRSQLISANIQALDAVLEQLPQIYDRFVSAYFTANTSLSSSIDKF